MRFTETPLSGAYVIDLETIEDDRGFFARAWCQREFEAQGLNARLVQCNLSFNRARGTLRGLHYQVEPHREVKLVRCIRGAIFDAIVDLRPGSPTYRRWFGVELTAENHQMLYVPEGFAHGYLTLSDTSEIFYQVSEFYASGSERGLRWDDPAFAIEWPIPIAVVSPRDQQHPPFRP
jgi:dTDP-4-dehydrorhamnose 3,5-epimerase